MKNHLKKFGIIAISLMFLLSIYFVSADNINGVKDNSITLKVGEETGYITAFNYLNVKLMNITQPLCKMAPCPKMVTILVSNKYIQTTKPIIYSLNEGDNIDHDVANIKVSAVDEDSATFVILDAKNPNNIIIDSKEPIITSTTIEKDKIVISVGGATGRDCEEYLKECNSGNSVLCEKWDTNCREKNFTVETKEEVKIENNKIYVNEKEIIMPDKASTTAIDNSGIKEEVKIELKDDEKPIYEITGTKEAKIFALFKTEMQVKTQIDAQTGSIEKTEKPWWSFLAKEE